MLKYVQTQIKRSCSSAMEFRQRIVPFLVDVDGFNTKIMVSTHTLWLSLKLTLAFSTKISHVPRKMTCCHSEIGGACDFLIKNDGFSARILIFPQKIMDFWWFSVKLAGNPPNSPKNAKFQNMGKYGNSTYFCTGFYGLIRAKYGLCTGWLEGTYFVRTFSVQSTYSPKSYIVQ